MIELMTSEMDVFGPGFVPGKVSVARDASSRAMGRSYAGIPNESVPESVIERLDDSSGDAKAKHDA